MSFCSSRQRYNRLSSADLMISFTQRLTPFIVVAYNLRRELFKKTGNDNYVSSLSSELFYHQNSHLHNSMFLLPKTVPQMW